MQLPLSLFHLNLLLLCIPTLATNPPFADSNSYNSIRNTIALYSLALDGKDFSLLSLVFTPDALADYTPLMPNVLSGLPQIEPALEAALRVVSSHHSLGTQLITIHENNTADAVTYLTASHFGAGSFTGQVYYLYGKYVDHLVQIDGHDDGGWRIAKRHLIAMGTGQGNIEIFTGTVNGTGAPSS